MGKTHNKSPPDGTSHIEGPYNEILVEITQDTDLRRKIIDIIKEYKEQIRELKGKNEELRRELGGKNDKLWKELEGENKNSRRN